MLERREDGAGPPWAATGELTSASWQRAIPGVTLARPPAMAVIGLRRGGRTGNGENPCGRLAPAQPGRATPFTPVRCKATCLGLPSPCARRAPRALEDSKDIHHRFPAIPVNDHMALGRVPLRQLAGYARHRLPCAGGAGAKLMGVA
jgi:hypothetical protein